MLSNIGQTNKNTSFGMSLKISDSAQKYLRNCNLSNKDIEKLANLVAKHENSPMTISIDLYNNKTLTGSIYDGKNCYENFVAPFWSQFLKKPISFIEKCCAEATLLKAKHYDSRLDEIFKKTK